MSKNPGMSVENFMSVRLTGRVALQFYRSRSWEGSESKNQANWVLTERNEGEKQSLGEQGGEDTALTLLQFHQRHYGSYTSR